MLGKTWHSRYNLQYRLKASFRQKTATLKKKHPNIEPFSVESNSLADNWWGKAWNSHLKIYAPKPAELEKGKLHFKCKALADLKVQENNIKAIVLDPKSSPKHVQINIAPLSETKWVRIQKMLSNHLELFERILDDHFPKEMKDLFKSKTPGIFPTPKEISFTCSCHHPSGFCHHIAAALSALGAKIDQEPKFIFQLRGINIEDFISQSIHTERNEILKRARNIPSNALARENLFDIFNIE